MPGFPCPICCNQTPASTVCTCKLIPSVDCGQDASQYSFTTTTITNSTCLDCTTYNGTFNMCYSTVNTRWESDPFASTICSHVANDPLWTLTRRTTCYELEAKGLSKIWEKSLATWDCLGANVMNRRGLAASTDLCGGFPASITLRPCVFFCASCTDGAFDNKSLTFSGFTDDYCVCSTYNATYIIPFIDDYGTYCWWYKAFGLTAVCSTATTALNSVTVDLGIYRYSTLIQMVAQLTLNNNGPPIKTDVHQFTKDFATTDSIVCSSQYTLPHSTLLGSTLCGRSTTISCQVN